MKLLFITGSRGEWGYIRPVLRLCQEIDDVDYKLCVTNMHLLPSFGFSAEEIKDDVEKLLKEYKENKKRKNGFLF